MTPTPHNTTFLSLKTKKHVKELAQIHAKQLGIPLGTLINAFLDKLGQTGGVHFIIAKPVTPKMAHLINKKRTEIANGDIYGPFYNDTAEDSLSNLPNEATIHQ